jgi:hypothetical protein
MKKPPRMFGRRIVFASNSALIPDPANTFQVLPSHQGIPDRKNSDTTELKKWRSRLYAGGHSVDSDRALQFRIR